MKLLKLSQGKQTIVDDEVYEWAKEFKWYTYIHRHNYYVRRNIYVKGKSHILSTLHREILGLKKGDKRQADHINRNGLDNRKVNLRICTSAENSQNRKRRNGETTSKFKGVNWHKQHKKFQATIFINSKAKHLGYFVSEIEAAHAYDEAANKYYGEFANLNFKKQKEKE